MAVKPTAEFSSTVRKNNPRKTRRGQKRGFKKSKLSLSIMGNNCNGIKGKLDTLIANIDSFSPSIVTIQETLLNSKNLVKLPGYQLFEHPRFSRGGGGLLTAIDQNLNAVQTSSFDDTVDILTVQLKANNLDVRIINAYGPQEDDALDSIVNFWQLLEEEAIAAMEEDCCIIIQLDANAKVGYETIKNDRNPMSANGRRLVNLVDRLNLFIVNSWENCEGLITRERSTVLGTEKSIIDYIIVCSRLRDCLDKMLIDDEQRFTLTKYAIKNGKRIKTLSYHNILFCSFSHQYNLRRKTLQNEIFQLKDKMSQESFYEATSAKGAFTGAFGLVNNFEHNANIFFGNLKKCIFKCFKRVRVVRGGRKANIPISEKQILLNQKVKYEKFLKLCSCEERQKKINAEKEVVINKLTDLIAIEKAAKIRDYIKSVENAEGSFSQIKLWKLKQRVCSKSADPPMAKKDSNGNLITTPDNLLNLYSDTYAYRLRNRQMKAELMDVYSLKMKLWKSRMSELSKFKTADWSLSQLKIVLKSLKNNKTADPNGMINELFKEGCIGSDLEQALLILFNSVKTHMHIPQYILKQNISTIYKNKGSRMEMKNDRGIFILTSLKRILDKLIYIDKQADIDFHMSDSNIGARKGKQVKDHLFIVHGIIHSIIIEKKECIDIQIYDLEQAFDSLWLEDCMIDLFDTLSDENRDDKLELLYKSCIDNYVAVNTPHGLTERKMMKCLVQQGGTWGPILCSNSVDTIGKTVWKTKETFYKYKNSVTILPLAMVDDILAVCKCGIESLSMNTFINSKIELKKLKFHTPDKDGRTKCHKIHVGGRNLTCPQLQVMNTWVT